MRTVAIWVIGAFVLLAVAPILLTLGGQELTASLTSANSTLDAVQPMLSKFAFGIAAVAIIAGGLLMAVGHGRGGKMVKGAVMLALIGAGSGVLLNYLGAQGPGLAASLTNSAGTVLTEVVQRLP